MKTDFNIDQNTSQSYPLSKEQEGLWFLQQLDPDISAYNVVFGGEIEGHLDIQTLERTFNFLIERHDVLNTTFETIEGKPYQNFEKNIVKGFDIQLNTDVSEIEEIVKCIDKDTKKPFNLSTDRLIRANLYQKNDQQHILVVTAHHIAIDLWGLAILLNELRLVYTAFKTNETPQLKPITANFRNHVNDQKALLFSEKGDSLLTYWKEKLSGELPVLDFPIDKVRPKLLTYNGKVERFSLDQELSNELVELAKQESVTLYMLLLGAYRILLQRYTNQEDILIGVPVAGRGKKETRNIIGNFVNTIVLRSSLDTSRNFSDFVKDIRKDVIDGMKHQEYPFSELVKELLPDRDPARSPLIQTAFAWERLPVLDDVMASLGTSQDSLLDIELFDVDQQEGQFEISLEMGNEVDGELHGLFKYNTDLLSSETVVQVIQHFKNLLRSIVKNPELSIAKLPILQDAEQEEILNIWQEKPQEFPKFNTLHQGFEAMVVKNPNAIAAVYDNTEMTYDELNKKANALAHHLKSLGAKKGTLIGLCVDRSIEVLVGIMGILKSGGAYVPLDPKNPKERLELIIDDAKTPIIITQGKEKIAIVDDQIEIVDLDMDWPLIETNSDENLDLVTGKDELAYVIYTSGSTGKPKGVLNTHHNVLRLFTATDHWYKFSENDVWTLFHTYAFDVSVWEIWGALLYGGKLAVVSYEVSRTPELFYDLLVDKKVTVLSQTPSAFKQLIEYEVSLAAPKDLSLSYVVFGGEALDIPALKPWVERHGDQSPKLINMYGITETTVHTTYREIVKEDLLSPKSMVGQPITDMKIHLLDGELNPVPYGVTGEIYVGGEGLAVKYLNREELTAERFIKDPYSTDANARLYKSGDLAQLYKNGDLKYIGRADTQVKIRGFRIELGEIQTLLTAHPSIKNAVVTTKNINDNDIRIVAYYSIEEEKEVTDKALRNYLVNRLPDYMIPSIFMEMESFALTINGKIDYRKLPMPKIKRDDVELILPRDVVELELQKIWEKTLKISPIGVKDDFFQLGGHSMLAVSIMSDIKLLFGDSFAISVLFQYPTIEKLGEIIREKKEIAKGSPLVRLQKGKSDKHPVFCIHPIGGNVFCYSPMVESIKDEYEIYGLQVPYLYEDGTPHITVEDIATDYIDNIKSVQEEGPYHLVGYCFGGLIATEIAHQLKEQGDQIGTLNLLDTRSPLYDDAEEFDDAILLSWFARDLALPYGKTLTIPPEELRECESVDKMFELVLSRAKNEHIVTDDINQDQMRRYLDVYISNGTALSLYEAKPYNGRINLLRAVHEPLIEQIGINLGWDRCEVKDLKVYDVPGNHNTMMYNPNAIVLAGTLQKVLAEYKEVETAVLL
ncbi:non-ribosomal peptide synthetase [Aquimarina sp. AD10]|uniref:non-ribosomal peptide synthetase n=1 Tax=Aquimarina sp. AD10 TaxID=1714849 RepID=UPI000E537F2F|nr:non-ribosomal peptide synthetase [Aquimarina sp. AD10]AXT59084.1 non-ribosomal peptide synthetase [Aquimarina sp. AD10]RKM92129.1 amino acid adenylation domain-containing protein [Aquimarina sp. AD10]